MKLAVIFVGTGEYLNFLPSWYDACERYLIPNEEKQYFIFTDGELQEVPDNIILYHQEHLSWPYITLLRWQIVSRAKDIFSNFDYVLFLDADTLIVKQIEVDEIFTDKKYIGVHHPCHFLGMPPHNSFPGAFETDKRSVASVTKDDDTSIYFQGCVWGGKVPYVIEMIEELQRRTQLDLNNDIIAQWHDESHMNKFFIERRDDVHTLPPSFAFPEDFKQYCNFEEKIVHISKNNQQYHNQ
jgi:hypothetical protein